MKRVLTSLMAMCLVLGSVPAVMSKAEAASINVVNTIEQFGAASFDPNATIAANDGVGLTHINVEEVGDTVYVSWAVANRQKTTVYLSVAKGEKWVVKGKELMHYTRSPNSFHSLINDPTQDNYVSTLVTKGFDSNTKRVSDPLMSGNKLYFSYIDKFYYDENSTGMAQLVTRQITLGENGEVKQDRLVLAADVADNDSIPYEISKITTDQGNGLLVKYNSYEDTYDRKNIQYKIILENSLKTFNFTDKHNVIDSSTSFYSPTGTEFYAADLSASRLYFRDGDLNDYVKAFDINKGEPVYSQDGEDKSVYLRFNQVIDLLPDNTNRLYTMVNGNVHVMSKNLDTLDSDSFESYNSIKDYIQVTQTSSALHVWYLVNFKREYSLKRIEINKAQKSNNPIDKNTPVIDSKTKVSVTINGTNQAFDQPPVIANGKTVVPLRKIFEALGATINWDTSTQTLTATKEKTTIIAQMESPVAQINGRYVPLEQSPIIVNGSLMVPVRFVGEALGAKVGWDAGSSTVLIETSK